MQFTKGAGGCHYSNGTVEVGLRKDMSMGWVVETLFHELSHKAHDHYVTPVINGKRRPHDWLFNRIMLGAMNEVMKKKTHELNPYAWGWSIGAGYAPTKKANDIMTELFNNLEKLPKKYAKFVQDAPIVEPKPEPTEEEILKKKMGGFRRTLTSCLKGMQNYDGYNEVMDDSWNIADGEEYILNLFDRIRPTMSIKEAGLDENEIVVLEWFIIEQQEVWFEFDAWRYDYSDSAFEKKSKRLHDLWDFLNR